MKKRFNMTNDIRDLHSEIECLGQVCEGWAAAIKARNKRSKKKNVNTFCILIPAAMAILKSADIIQQLLIAEF